MNSRKKKWRASNCTAGYPAKYSNAPSNHVATRTLAPADATTASAAIGTPIPVNRDATAFHTA
ncbi:MAG: hypothetical protein DMF97_16805 [Acidobacteria bacterium]|nr:MAG: hypothetical protein DMF97_16805 [Acidobacteriota bacterium]